jgi:hypothetical protein
MYEWKNKQTFFIYKIIYFEFSNSR